MVKKNHKLKYYTDSMLNRHAISMTSIPLARQTKNQHDSVLPQFKCISTGN
jgi:hypothetical protein